MLIDRTIPNSVKICPAGHILSSKFPGAFKTLFDLHKFSKPNLKQGTVSFTHRSETLRVEWYNCHRATYKYKVLIKITSNTTAFHSNLTAKVEDISSAPSDSTILRTSNVLRSPTVRQWEVLNWKLDVIFIPFSLEQKEVSTNSTFFNFSQTSFRHPHNFTNYNLAVTESCLKKGHPRVESTGTNYGGIVTTLILPFHW